MRSNNGRLRVAAFMATWGGGGQAEAGENWQGSHLRIALTICAAGKTTPLFVVLTADVFNSLNAYVNARWVSNFGQYDIHWLTSPAFLLKVR